jgi:cobalt/nickel transport system permease protein
MARLALDEAAWSGPWRSRSTAEKVLLSGGMLLLAVTARSVWVAGGLLVVIVALALLMARVPWRTYLLALAGPLTFALLGALAIVVTFSAAPGADDIVRLGPGALTRSGLMTATLVVVRSTAGAAAMLLLACTTSLLSIIEALRRVHVPDAIVDIAALMYRMLFALLDSVGAIREAQTARLGYATAGAARRSFGMLAAATLRRSWEQSRRLEEGLAGRGSSGSLRSLTVDHPVDRRFLALTGMLLLGLAGWSLLMGGAR